MKTLFQLWYFALLISLSVTTSLTAQPTKYYDVNASLSITDAFNVGFRYGFGQNNIGVNLGGALPRGGFWLVIPSVSYYRHLWGHSKFTDVMPWYIKGAVHFLYSESELTRGNTSATRHTGARVYMGRNFNITPRLTFSSAIGPVYIFLNEYYGNQRVEPRVVPGLDLMIFYRLER